MHFSTRTGLGSKLVEVNAGWQVGSIELNGLQTDFQVIFAQRPDFLSLQVENDQGYTAQFRQFVFYVRRWIEWIWII